MKTLSCLVIRDRSVIVVVIREIRKVALVKNMIKKKKMHDSPADQLGIYVAKKDSKWLKLNDPDVQWFLEFSGDRSNNKHKAEQVTILQETCSQVY
ncbi:hypothetical protein V7S43_000006 [Phytophthora oleae]|uniref:Crinkler effector protein N-terminal domain-containing protein n=1 Tax=Phytophthora oleae TaxID=2107226 RepID=A0ABD3G6G7_9STRA